MIVFERVGLAVYRTVVGEMIIFWENKSGFVRRYKERSSDYGGKIVRNGVSGDAANRGNKGPSTSWL